MRSAKPEVLDFIFPYETMAAMRKYIWTNGEKDNGHDVFKVNIFLLYSWDIDYFQKGNILVNDADNKLASLFLKHWKVIGSDNDLKDTPISRIR